MGLNKTIFVLMLALSLFGCAVTSEQLRASPKETGSFHVDKPFHLVRTNLINVFQSCFKANMPAARSWSEVLDTAPGQALTIEGILGHGDRDVVFSIDASKNANGGTDITYYKGAWGIFMNHRKKVESWVNGTGNNC